MLLEQPRRVGQRPQRRGLRARPLQLGPALLASQQHLGRRPAQLAREHEVTHLDGSDAKAQTRDRVAHLLDHPGGERVAFGQELVDRPSRHPHPQRLLDGGVQPGQRLVGHGQERDRLGHLPDDQQGDLHGHAVGGEDLLTRHDVLPLTDVHPLDLDPRSPEPMTTRGQDAVDPTVAQHDDALPLPHDDPHL